MTSDQKALSQWMTDPALAARIVNWALKPDDKPKRALEPSAGEGSFVGPLVKALGAENVVAVEIDTPLSCRLQSQYSGVQVVNQDFTGWVPDGALFDLAVMNSPYEGGQDTDHLSHALEVARRVVAITRTNILHGQKRFDRIWSKAYLRRKINFIDRPRFSGSDGSPRHDFCVIEVSKEALLDRYGVQHLTAEWWRAR